VPAPFRRGLTLALNVPSAAESRQRTRPFVLVQPVNVCERSSVPPSCTRTVKGGGKSNAGGPEKSPLTRMVPSPPLADCAAIFARVTWRFAASVVVVVGGQELELDDVAGREVPAVRVELEDLARRRGIDLRPVEPARDERLHRGRRIDVEEPGGDL